MHTPGSRSLTFCCEGSLVTKCLPLSWDCIMELHEQRDENSSDLSFLLADAFTRPKWRFYSGSYAVFATNNITLNCMKGHIRISSLERK
jgi:hypothetical protein